MRAWLMGVVSLQDKRGRQQQRGDDEDHQKHDWYKVHQEMVSMKKIMLVAYHTPTSLLVAYHTPAGLTWRVRWLSVLCRQ